MVTQEGFQTPDSKLYPPGGALRLLLRRRPSFANATPGTPASPHLDSTPDKVGEVVLHAQLSELLLPGRRLACFCLECCCLVAV